LVYTNIEQKIESDATKANLFVKENIDVSREVENEFGDDWKNVYETFKSDLEENNEYSMCFHNVNRLYEFPTATSKEYDVLDKEYTIDELFLHWIAPTSSVVFNRNVIPKINEIALDKRVLNGDIIIVLSAFTIGKVRGFSDFMSSYRIHEKGVSFARINENYLKHLLNYISHYKLIGEKFESIDRKVLNIKLVDNYISITMYYLKRKKLQFLYYLILAVFYRPDLITKALLKPFKRK
jgi:hypothetical protein